MRKPVSRLMVRIRKFRKYYRIETADLIPVVLTGPRGFKRVFLRMHLSKFEQLVFADYKYFNPEGSEADEFEFEAMEFQTYEQAVEMVSANPFWILEERLKVKALVYKT